MFSALTTTELLAAFIGLYFVAAGVGLLIDGNSWSAMLHEFIDQPALGFIAGLLTFLIGATIIGLHNRWDGLLPGFVSVVGWIALLEGILMLSARRYFLGFFASLALSDRTILMFGVFTTTLGGFLLMAVAL